MAQWQVHFQVVPHRAMAGAPRALSAETVASTDWWGVGVVPPDLGASIVLALEFELERGNRCPVVEVGVGRGRYLEWLVSGRRRGDRRCVRRDAVNVARQLDAAARILPRG